MFYVFCGFDTFVCMALKIHATALVDPAAEIGEDAEIGPYAIVEPGVTIGARTKLWAHAYLCSGTRVGSDCVIHMGAVVGHAPQDFSYKGEPTGAVVGNGVVVRENVTIHRATKPANPTTVGDGCFLMAGSHVAHDCQLGKGVILANGAQLAGHVEIGNGAIVSGNVVIHQFVRIGRLAILSGGSRFGMDVPPYLIGDGTNAVTSLNAVGLRRSKEISDAERPQIKAAYKLLYRSELDLKEALARLKAEFDSPAVKAWVAFFEHPTKRGFCHYKASRRESAD